MAKPDSNQTKGQQEIEAGTDQIKGGADQAEAGAEHVASGLYSETWRGISRVAALPGEALATGRNVWLAGLGALSAAEEEGAKFYEDLVSRGEAFEGRGREQISETAGELNRRQQNAVKSASDTVVHTTSAVEQLVNGAFRGVFGRLDVPTRGEVQGLAEKVERLAQKLDGVAVALEKQQTGTATVKVGALVTYHVSPHDEGWAVTKEGAERATSVYGTKKEAVEGGRELAKSHAPSELVVHKQDRSVQETFAYQDEED